MSHGLLWLEVRRALSCMSSPFFVLYYKSCEPFKTSYLLVSKYHERGFNVFSSNRLRMLVKGAHTSLVQSHEVRVMSATRTVFASIKIKSSRNVSYGVLAKCLMIFNRDASLMKTVLEFLKDPRFSQLLTLSQEVLLILLVFF